MLTKERAVQQYGGGTLVAYYLDTGGFDDFLLGDIRECRHPREVVLSPLWEGRVEVRYGDPDEPQNERIVAFVTPRKGRRPFPGGGSRHHVTVFKPPWQ